jgi:hypothetical protein
LTPAHSRSNKADSFEERIDNALSGLREERDQLRAAASELASYLLTFFTCEIVAKAIVSHVKYGRVGRKALSDKWSTKDVSSALTTLGIPFDENSIDALFSTEQKLAGEMSARALRDSVAHRMKDTHRRAVRARFKGLMAEMEQFLGLVELWRKQTASAPKTSTE